MNQNLNKAIPVLILGGNGYVSGELLRLLLDHPLLSIGGVVSSSQAQSSVLSFFPHLKSKLDPNLKFTSFQDWLSPDLWRQSPEWGVFFSTPHGATSKLAQDLIHAVNSFGIKVKVVDLSADFRFKDADLYQKVYGQVHQAPELLKKFVCALPDIVALEGLPFKTIDYVAHPGCFTTATVLGAYPFCQGKNQPQSIFVSAVTGSTGSGRTPSSGTHHPERRNNLYAYSPLSHRHEHEMQQLLKNQVDFVPHSGPFARGIHATIRIALENAITQDQAFELLSEFYRDSIFVSVLQDPPKISEVAMTNRCHLSVRVKQKSVIVFSAIDNMMKGSAGGGLQWLNLLLGFEPQMGLNQTGLGWY